MIFGLDDKFNHFNESVSIVREKETKGRGVSKCKVSFQFEILRFCVRNRINQESRFYWLSKYMQVGIFLLWSTYNGREFLSLCLPSPHPGVVWVTSIPFNKKIENWWNSTLRWSRDNTYLETMSSAGLPEWTSSRDCFRPLTVSSTSLRRNLAALSASRDFLMSSWASTFTSTFVVSMFSSLSANVYEGVLRLD